MTIRVVLFGGSGRMGRFTRELLEGVDDLELVAWTRRGDDLATVLTEHAPEVALDLTVAGLGAEHGLQCLSAGVRPVIGTSGVTPEEDARLDAAAREVGLAGLVVPNFCLGVWLQQKLALEAARYFEAVEVLEEHHATKVDAPSGTAADTARQLAEQQGREPGSIPIHSLRLPGLYANQSVVFGGLGEVLRLRHEVQSQAAFGPGILASLRYVMAAEPGVRRGVGHAFEHAADRSA